MTTIENDYQIRESIHGGDQQMNRSNTSIILKALTALLGAAVLFVVLFSSLYIMLEADHDCCGEDCHICETLENCQATLHQIGSVPVTGSAVIVSAFFFIALSLREVRRFSNETPVSDKVQLNI